MFDEKFIRTNLPFRLRKPKRIAWLKSLFSASKKLYDSFVVYRQNILNCIQYNSQTLSLQEWLRNYFNSLEINVINQLSNVEPTFVFWLNEDQQIDYDYWLSEDEENDYIYWLSEQSNSTLNYQFIVEAPIALTPRRDELVAQINKLKLAGKDYLIRWI